MTSVNMTVDEATCSADADDRRLATVLTRRTVLVAAGV